MKKLAIVAGIILLLLILTACSDNNPEDPNNVTIVPIITISEAGNFTLQECQDRGLENKIVMIESKFCGHCQETKPIFLQACQELGIVPELLDIAETEGREKMLSYSVQVQYTPTFIFNCKYYVGEMSKEEYKELLK